MFELDDAERVSPLWARLLRHFEARIVTLRLQNDDPTKDERATALIRGQIKAYRDLIALNTDRPDLSQV